MRMARRMSPPCCPLADARPRIPHASSWAWPTPTRTCNTPTRSPRWHSISTSRLIAPTAIRIGADDTAGERHMSYTLEQFAADCHAALKDQPGTPGREKVRGLVSKALKTPGFVEAYIPEGTPERKVLYEDAEL